MIKAFALGKAITYAAATKENGAQIVDVFGLIDVCNGNAFNRLKTIGKTIQVATKPYITVNWPMKKYPLTGAVNPAIAIPIKSTVHEG